MPDLGLALKIAIGGYAATLITLGSVLAFVWVLGMVAKRIQAKNKKTTNK